MQFTKRKFDLVILVYFVIQMYFGFAKETNLKGAPQASWEEGRQSPLGKFHQLRCLEIIEEESISNIDNQNLTIRNFLSKNPEIQNIQTLGQIVGIGSNDFGTKSGVESPCYWVIMFQQSYSVSIDITCDNDNNQEINLITVDTTGAKKLIGNEMLRCVEGYRQMKFDSLNYLLLKVYTFVPNSPFKILIYQTNSVQKYKFSWILIVILMLGIIIIVVIIAFMLLNSENQKQSQTQSHYDQIQIISMYFINGRIKYEQKGGSIGMDEFVEDSKISVIIKGNHIFHKMGLKEWLQKSKTNDSFTCPNCRTDITDNT